MPNEPLTLQQMKMLTVRVHTAKSFMSWRDNGLGRLRMHLAGSVFGGPHWTCVSHLLKSIAHCLCINGQLSCSEKRDADAEEAAGDDSGAASLAAAASDVQAALVKRVLPALAEQLIVKNEVLAAPA